MANKVRCKKCGGRLAYEEFFQRGKIYDILPDGTIGKRFKYNDYFGNDDGSMVYCRSCGDSKSFRIVDGYSRVVVEETDEDAEEWE